MATYRQIQDHVRATANYVPKTCWIANVKNDYGLTTRSAPNRHSATGRIHPCPSDKRNSIEQALRYFGMIK
jgi:hypothetical protein